MDDYLRTQRVRRTLRLRIRLYLWSFLVFTIAGGGTYVLFYSDVFRVRSITVQGLSGASREPFLRELTNTALAEHQFARFIPRTNYFAWPSAIRYATPEIGGIAIRKNLQERSVQITVSPRVPFGIWCSIAPIAADSLSAGAGDAPATNCVWFDERDGTVMREASEPQGSLVAVVYETGDKMFAPGDAVLPMEHFTNLKEIFAIADRLKLSVVRARALRDAQALELETAERARLVFSLRTAPLPTLSEALQSLLEQEDLKRIEYIDFTVENKVYVKNR